MTVEEIIEKYGQEFYDNQNLSDEQEKLLEQQIEEYENRDWDEYLKEQEDFNRRFHPINELLEEFHRLSYEEQDNFLEFAKTVVRYRGKSLYEDLPSEQEEIGTRLNSIEDFLKKMMLNKPNEQKSIEEKTRLSVSDFAKKYNIGKTKQQSLRDFKKLPYEQLVEGGKITYIVEEVEKWLKNNTI
jgi:cyclopropane fatty-acyl-phospholipid synthase-like methyltransferase